MHLVPLDLLLHEDMVVDLRNFATK